MIRDPDARELAILERLLEQPFDGLSCLAKQLPGLKVETVDADGSLTLFPCQGAACPGITRRVAVEASYRDSDSAQQNGARVHVLLHARKGMLHELEVYKDDSMPIIRQPTVEDLEIEPYC